LPQDSKRNATRSHPALAVAAVLMGLTAAFAELGGRMPVAAGKTA
jgi:hypothetical protein